MIECTFDGHFKLPDGKPCCGEFELSGKTIQAECKYLGIQFGTDDNTCFHRFELPNGRKLDFVSDSEFIDGLEKGNFYNIEYTV